jgi:CTP:phosphocholine cytidylyltransferase-like protein
MHEESKRKEKSAHSGDTALVATQSKRRMQTGPRLCYNCSKPGHFARNCFQDKKNESAYVASKEEMEVEHAFASNDGDDNTMAKWIMDSGATKHMSPHRAAFQTYKVISPPRNVH